MCIDYRYFLSEPESTRLVTADTTEDLLSYLYGDILDDQSPEDVSLADEDEIV
jgi:hypothetical protein